MKTINPVKLISLITLSLTFILTISSCKNATEKAAEKILEKSIERSTGEIVDIDIENQTTVIETEEGRVEINALQNSWPKDIPSEIPEFNYGKITGVTSTTTDDNKTWTVVFTEVKKDAIDQYNKDLKGKGFKTQTVTMSGLGGTISAETEKMTIAVMIGEGEASVSVQVKI